MAGLATMLGSGAMTNSIGDISAAACCLLIGANTSETHPVIGIEIKKAVKNGTKLIVANPMKIPMARHADVWLRHKPGTDVALLMGMAKVILDENLTDTSFIKNRCENYAVFESSLEFFDTKTVEQITGVNEKDIREAARMYATSKPASIMYCLGITEHSHGTDNVKAIANLALLTGNYGVPGSGVNPLRGQNNVQGACDMGALPDVYPGYQKVNSPEARKKFENYWGVKLPSVPGLTIMEMFQAIDEGHIKALYIVGDNPVLSNPDLTGVKKSLERLELLVVQDLFLTETAEYADVVLPAMSFAERDGTFTNTERRVQKVRKAVRLNGSNAVPDWLITCQIARKMGASGFQFNSAEEIMTEIAELAPVYGGITYQRLEKGGLQWPCADVSHPGTPILHSEKFTRGAGCFMPLEYKPLPDLPDDDYPLILTTGRSIYHYHTGTNTRRVKGLNILDSREQLQISKKDAVALGISDGDRVSVCSPAGRVDGVHAKVTDAVPVGMVFMTFHFAESPTNVLTSAKHLDPISKTPPLKISKVRVVKID